MTVRAHVHVTTGRSEARCELRPRGVGVVLELEQVVLAQRMERDLADDDELVVAAVVWEARGVEGSGESISV